MRQREWEVTGRGEFGKGGWGVFVVDMCKTRSPVGVPRLRILCAYPGILLVSELYMNITGNYPL